VSTYRIIITLEVTANTASEAQTEALKHLVDLVENEDLSMEIKQLGGAQ
jgi:hypothetical protein